MNASVHSKRATFGVLLFLVTVSLSAQTIVYPDDGSDLERLAAHEVRRYVYLRTGEFLPLRQGARLPAEGDAIAIG